MKKTFKEVEQQSSSSDFSKAKTRLEGRHYYIGVKLESSQEDLVPDDRQKLGDRIAQNLDGMTIDGLKPNERHKWHMTIGWFENKDSYNTPVSDEDYKKILPYLAPIISKYQQLELQLTKYTTNWDKTSIHAKFEDASGNLAALRAELQATINSIVPYIKFNTAWPHAVVAHSSKKIDKSQIPAVVGNEIYQIANMSMIYFDVSTKKNGVSYRFATASSQGFFSSSKETQVSTFLSVRAEPEPKEAHKVNGF